MKHLHFFIFLFSISFSAQENIQTTFLTKTKLKVDVIVNINTFNTLFYINNNIFIKKDDEKKVNYSNIQLGKITSANSFNPLKPNIFYKAFNTVVILDNRLAEIYKIDFNQTKIYKNVSHISTGSDNTIWIFNQDLMLLELYDYKTNATRAKTLPVESNVIDMVSNYNSCWLLTKNFIYKYNYFGSLEAKIKNNGFTAIKESNENIILKKDHSLFYISKKTKTAQLLTIPNLLINQFLVTNQIVYIYTDGLLYQYQLKF